MCLLPGSIAPLIPQGADVIGIINVQHRDSVVKVKTATRLAAESENNPVSDALQGGLKHVNAFYVISCEEDCHNHSHHRDPMEGVHYVTDFYALSVYPLSPSVQCSRLCEAHAFC
ncbi:hypothetical protein AGDE_14620 [Angomonas deanei]|uniref:Uncharacterized protein n=1 Tax=Angomonas deanei TaxID=59799 RepID=A0A7G2CT57_9TRYP|nr:hypothetical protein AGDE_14620 [Angomonas deanei]CAD2222427.1 hypothetical protein, conserved [Angomonas deanei]|eukprot:EPY20535.1 hypothetical protein AGDE_14620 [Angomonas deanei]